MKIIKMCCTAETCPEFKLTEDNKWIIIEDNFSGSIRIPADKELLIKTIEKLFIETENIKNG